MKARKRKNVDKAWAEFQALHQISDETLALIRQVHGRVSELLRTLPDPPPASVEDWIRQRHRQWIEKSRPAADKPPQRPMPRKKSKRTAALDSDWAKAKKLCRLNQSDIAMAKRLGLRPRSLTKNRPSPSQQWKAPVKEWIHALYAKRFGQRPASLPPQQTTHPPNAPLSDEVPF